MALIDSFKGNAFKMSSLGASINIVPNTYGRVRQLGLTRMKRLPTTTFKIEFKNGVLNLLQTSERGGAGGTVGKRPKRNAKPYEVLHIEHDDFIYADDIQNVRAFGSEFQLQGLQELMNDSLETLAGKFDITEEWHLVQMIQGRLLDADGTELFNAFTDFGITRTSFDFDLGNDNSDVDKVCLDVQRHMEDNLLGETMTSAHALVDSDFFDAFTAHPQVREAYKFYASQQEPLREDTRRSFRHKGLTLEEYRGRASHLEADDTVTTRKFVPTNEGAAFPIGTRNTFQTYYGPPDFVNAANKPGQRLVVKMLADPSGKDKFVGVHAQSNPFHLCTRPALLPRLHTSS